MSPGADTCVSCTGERSWSWFGSSLFHLSEHSSARDPLLPLPPLLSDPTKLLCPSLLLLHHPLGSSFLGVSRVRRVSPCSHTSLEAEDVTSSPQNPSVPLECWPGGAGGEAADPTQAVDGYLGAETFSWWKAASTEPAELSVGSCPAHRPLCAR